MTHTPAHTPTDRQTDRQTDRHTTTTLYTYILMLFMTLLYLPQSEPQYLLTA